MESPSVEDPPSPIRFRPSKKRKAAYRQRTDDASNDLGELNNQPDLNISKDGPAQSETIKAEELSDEETAVAAALRLRNARKARLRGVGFRSDARPDDDGSNSISSALVLADHNAAAPDTVVVPGITNRFTHQTGLVGELNDKHMAEYIESRLSSRSAPAAQSSSRSRPADGDTQQQQQQHHTLQSGSSAEPAAPRPREQPVLQGKLMEVDIQEALRGRGTGNAQDQAHQRGAKRPRLGKDGKPWRPRNRRTSDDIKRDQLVEQLLHENRLDVYETLAPSSSSFDAHDPDGAADERLAEQFQKQYMDDMAQRRQRRKPAQPAKPTTEEVLRGPKLGGSRNSRAAMRDLLLKKEKEAKDTKR